jgi:hypothetical protein
MPSPPSPPVSEKVNPHKRKLLANSSFNVPPYGMFSLLFISQQFSDLFSYYWNKYVPVLHILKPLFGILPWYRSSWCCIQTGQSDGRMPYMRGTPATQKGYLLRAAQHRKFFISLQHFWKCGGTKKPYRGHMNFVECVYKTYQYQKRITSTVSWILQLRPHNIRSLNG